MPLREITAEPQDTLLNAIRVLLGASAALYMHVARKTISTFRFEGERAIRRHLRAYGRWRGKEMRMAHQALGLAINMETLMKNWDSASTLYGGIETQGFFSPHKVVHEISACPAAELWKAHDFRRWGHMYCDEFHQACVSAYHPEACVVIPENLMKGDPACKFSWVMPPQTENQPPHAPSELGQRLAKNYQPSSPQAAVISALKRTVRIHSGRYVTMARELLSAFGRRGEEVLSQALRSWSQERGEALRNRHAALGLPRTAQSLFNHFDMPYQYLWDASQGGEGRAYVLEVSRCAFAEVWRDLDAEELGAVYCRETYPALMQSYGLKDALTLGDCQCNGDAVCRFECLQQ